MGKITNNYFKRTNSAFYSHEHADHEERAKAEKKFGELRETVKTSRAPIRDDHADAMYELQSRKAASLLAFPHCRRTLQRIQQDKFPQCNSLADLEKLLEDDDGDVYKTFGQIRDSRFYQGSIDGQLVFANLDLIAELPEKFDAYVDATFDLTPFHAGQLLIILGEIHHRPRPLAYIIMTGKSEEKYKQIFDFLNEAIFCYDGTMREPKTATCDFEQAIRSAVTKVWKNALIYGCNFHLCQAERRKARSIESISKELKPGSIYSEILLLFMRLSLLPLNRIDKGFQAIIHYIRTKKLTKAFQPFVDYFRSTWFVRFKKETWCMSDRNRRTNNNLEGYNNKVTQKIGINPTPMKFLTSLRDLAIDASAVFDSDKSLNAPPPADRSAISIPLAFALQELNSGKINELEFLQKMAKVRGKKKEKAKNAAASTSSKT
jgi:hypothetical protein